MSEIPTREADSSFVITRKRKRRSAIDPCLGFYTGPPPIKLSNGPEEQQDVTEHAGSTTTDPVPQWTVLPTDPPSANDITTPSPHSSDPPPVTVEMFLQRNARRIHVRKYGRRNKNRRIVLSSSGPPSSDCVDQLDEDERPRTSKKLWHTPDSPENCGPTKSAAKIATELNRPALRFVPVKPDKPRTKPRPIRLWTTVDARKGVPFRSSSFSLSERSTVISSGSLKQHPLNTWSTFGRSTSTCVPPGKRSKKIPTQKRSTRRTPLVFIPLVDAEEAYKKKYHAAKLRFVLGLVLDDLVDTFHGPSSTIQDNIQPSGRQPLVTAVAPLILVPATNTISAPSSQKASCSSPLIYSSPPATPPVPIPELPIFTPPQPLAPESITSENSSLILDSQVGPSSTSNASSGKRLKPLRSFFDGFLERVRTATQREAYSEHQICEALGPNTEIEQHRSSREDLYSPCDKLADYTPEVSALSHLASAVRRPGDRSRRPQSIRPSRNCTNEESFCVPEEGHCYQQDTDDMAQSEFPPYVPPTPLDINAVLRLYAQAASSEIRL